MRWKHICMAATLITVAGCQSSGAPGSSTAKIASAGQPQQLTHFYSLTKDCMPLGPISVRITDPAAHGSTVAVEGSGPSDYPASDPRSACNGKATPGMNLVYTATPGYSGTDKVAGYVFDPNGSHYPFGFSITVR